MDAIVTAGGIPQPGEPLYEYTQGISKALLDVCGKPMAQWVLDALNEAEAVDQIVLVGLTPESGLKCPKIKAYIPNQGSMLDNVRAGMLKIQEINPEAEYILIVSSDIPAIKPDMVDWVVNNALKTQHDIYYHVIERKVMEARYPGSKRTYTRLKDVEVCGGDMNVARVMTSTENDVLWTRIINARKNVIKQASLIGWDTLFMLLTRQATLKKAEEMACKRLRINGKAVLCPYAEIGMDIDKPGQLEMICSDFKEHISGD